MGLRLVEPDVLATWPRARDVPIIFLLDADDPTERLVLREWIESHRPDNARYEIIELPRRKGLRRSSTPAALHRLLDKGDAVLAPLRVAWLAPKREGRRSVKFSDLLFLGDPRDPFPITQAWLHRFRPDRIEARTATEVRLRSPEAPPMTRTSHVSGF